MKEKPKQPTVPRDRQETERQRIMALLTTERLSAKEISEQVRISEKQVVEHLEHIRQARRGFFVIFPPCCLSCGFTFRKREKLKGPGKCPVCRSEHIAQPEFTLA
jgi:hypothetical protein